SVSVLTQPSNPVQTCSIANGSGTVTNAAAAPTINCVTQSPCLAGGFNTGDGQGRFLYLLNNGAASVAAFRLDPASASLQAASQRTPVRSRFSCIALENSPTWLTSVPRTYPQKLTLGPSMIGTGAGPSLLAFDAGGQNGYVVTSFDTPAYPWTRLRECSTEGAVSDTPRGQHLLRSQWPIPGASHSVSATPLLRPA